MRKFLDPIVINPTYQYEISQAPKNPSSNKGAAEIRIHHVPRLSATIAALTASTGEVTGG
jgi:hypothetical protein